MPTFESKGSASSRFGAFLSLVLVFAFGATSVLMYRMNTRIQKVEEKSDQPSATRTSNTAPAQKPAEGPQASEEIKARLTFLENQQGNIAATSKGALEQMYFIFMVVSGFFGLFAAFSAYRQLLADTGQEKHDQEMLSLVGSFRKNIDVISGLITTLQQTYEFKGKVEERIQHIDHQIVQIDRFKQRTEQTLREKLDDTNTEALTLFRRPLDRQSFKSEEMKGKLQTFYVNMNTVERMGDISGLLNPFTYFCRALSFFNQMQYEPASKDLEEASRLGHREVEAMKPTMTWYGECTEAQVKEQLQRMLSDCSYHLGIIYYNLGRFEAASKGFREAFSIDKLDFRSRIYIPELMFFDPAVPFAKVRLEYQAVYRELNNLSLEARRSLKMDYEEAIASLKMREGNIYLPKKVRLPARDAYRGEENADLAVSCYREAFEHSRRIAQRETVPLTEVFASVSLAQGLELVGTSQWGQQQPVNLFRDAFHDISKQIVFKTEPNVLVQLNYFLAICAERAFRGTENPRTYLSRPGNSCSAYRIKFVCSLPSTRSY